MRFGSFIVGLLLVQSAFASFPDVPRDHDNWRAMEYVQVAGIMTGYPDGTFGPDRSLNRAELMKILVESLGGISTAGTSACFPDVRTTDWFQPYVCAAKERGWVSGYPDGSFRPAQSVNMVEALKMIVNAQGYLPRKETNPYAGYDTSAWYAPYVATAIRAGVVAPETIWSHDGERLDGPLSRKRVAEFLYRAALANADVEFSFVHDCDINRIRSVQLMRYDRKEYSDRTVDLELDLVGILDDGSSCSLAERMNPYGSTSKHFHSVALFLQNTEARGSVQTASVQNKTILLVGGHETAGPFDDAWEFDLLTGTLHQRKAQPFGF